MQVKATANQPTSTVSLIDWHTPEANDFAIAEEVTLKGPQERHLDLVLYVNGIAIGVIELQRSRISIGDGIRQNLSILAAWYRSQLRYEAISLIDKWQQRLHVKANKLFIQAMTRQWGSCNTSTRNIRLNTQLAQKPKDCLDYVTLHELAHPRVPRHGEEFIAPLDSHLPDWEERRRLLNNLPPSVADPSGSLLLHNNSPLQA
ncbi:MAG: YgjP-like metallopeptidase domain-containing protein [Prochlorococcaceae cyanobacterium]